MTTHFTCISPSPICYVSRASKEAPAQFISFFLCLSPNVCFISSFKMQLEIQPLHGNGTTSTLTQPSHFLINKCIHLSIQPNCVSANRAPAASASKHALPAVLPTASLLDPTVMELTGESKYILPCHFHDSGNSRFAYHT